jgi:hypothetical protein
MAGDPNSDALIEKTSVPELEIITLQQQLNARTRAGTLSGPLLAENGKLDAQTQARQREQEAFDAIALAKLDPRKPEDARAHDAARAEDERVLAFVREELVHIGDTGYMDHDHKAPTLTRIRKLEATFRRKWAAAGQAAEQIEALLREVVRPGALLVADGAFDYGRLEHALATMRKLEAALLGVPTDDADYPGLAEKVAGYRQAIVAGLSGKPAVKAAPPAPTPTAELAPPPPPPPRASAPLPPRPATSDLPPPAPVVPGFVPDPERERKGRELDMMGPEGRMALFREHGGEAGGDDPLLAQIAASMVRTHPDAFTPQLAAHLDGYAMHELLRDEAKLGHFAKVPPKARLAMLKDLAARPAGPEEEAPAATLAGALAATLLRQHPQAAAEVLGHPGGAPRPEISVAMLARLSDEEVAKLPRESLHALYKEIQGRNAGDDRRHLARLVRLMNKR